MKLVRWFALAVSAGLLMVAPMAQAATDGVAPGGVQSIGDVYIQLAVGDVVRISGLTDFLLGNWAPGDGQIDATQSICLYSTSGAYNVTADSTNGAGAFQMMDLGGNVLPYLLAWDDVAGSSYAAGAALADNALLAAQATTETLEHDCATNGPTATLAIRITAPSLAVAVDGVYSDTVVLTVNPE